jgi:peptidyl-prolyl cis-trans isomerase D
LGRGAEKWSQYPELLQVAFSPTIVTEKRNSEVISLNPERALVVRLKQHSPAEQQTFEAIINQVKADYVEQISTQRLKAAGEKIVEAIQLGESPDQALKPYQVTWKTKADVSRRDQSMDRWIVDKAFMLGRAPLLAEPPKPVIAAFPLPSGDYGILSITKVILGTPNDADAKTKSMAEKNVIDSWMRAEFGLWAHMLASTASIQLMPIPTAFQQTSDSH